MGRPKGTELRRIHHGPRAVAVAAYVVPRTQGHCFDAVKNGLIWSVGVNLMCCRSFSSCGRAGRVMEAHVIRASRLPTLNAQSSLHIRV